MTSATALSRLNFSLADVRDGLGPFLGIYLIGMGWAPDQIGFVMTVAGIASLVATTPAGALVDATRYKRALVVGCATLIIVVNFALLLWPVTWVVGLSQAATGIAAAAIGPAILGLTLGLVGQNGLSHQLGQNQAYNHAGNAAAAILAAVGGYFFGIQAVFILMAIMALFSIIFVLRIDPAKINHKAARGADEKSSANVGFLTVLRDRPMVLVVGITLLFFHLGNAAMLPLLGQRVATNEAMNPTIYTAGTMIIAQMTMIPMALIAARYAAVSGYWALFVAALIVLPVRGLIAGFYPDLWAVVPVQILDGVGAGLLGVATPGIIAQLLSGTGRVNVGLGAVMTMQGIGAAFSTTYAGVITAWFGYEAAFFALAGAALVALLVWLVVFNKPDGTATVSPDERNAV